ncbi:pyridoxal phosphate-dependent transferase [Xylaria venustula]|nr:pyridoxal phosphate-dependent transferase [Xylaria venustula]
MLRSYIHIARQSKRNVIVCLAPERPRQFQSASGVSPAQQPSTARMVAGQSVSAAKGELKEKRVGRSEGKFIMAGTTDQTKKKSINLLRGWPSTSLLPAEALRTASQTALSDPRIWAPGLEYGPDPGYQPLREALARWLGRFYEGVLPPTTNTPATQGEDNRTSQAGRKETGADRITITGGASQSLACVLQSFTDPAQTLAVWVVAPCYFLACPIFGDAGFAGRLRAVPEDDEGADIEFLEREMRVLEKKQKQKERNHSQGDSGKGQDGGIGLNYKDPGPHRKIYRHVVYCVPAFANPSGRTMTLARRKSLVALAREHDALIICDDVYDMLQWRRTESLPPATHPDLHTALLPRIADIDIAQGRSAHDPPDKHFGHAMSNGSFSKLVAPGTRTGWTYSTADFAIGMSQTGSTRSGGAASQLAATIVCELLQSPPKPSPLPTSSVSTPLHNPETSCELDTHIRHTLLPSYARRHAVLTRAIREVLVPLGVRFTEDSLVGHEGVYGGYFVWMTLPRTESTTKKKKIWPSAREIADRCRADEDLMIGNGELFAVHGDEEAVRFDDAIRFCFAYEDEEDLVDGVERLGRVLRTMLDEGPEGWGVKAGELGDIDQTK